MKPDKLIISGWGPYAGEEQVDFGCLRQGGLFLVTGPTGAGKTTIFDGITFALYGEVSGSVREKDSLRSDFAKASVPTYVELWFTHQGKQYRVIRNPKYDRPKLRGEGTTAKAEDGQLYEGDKLLASGSQQVTEAVRELLGINYRQFKQISMIAQGEFQQLLMASSKERTQIFRDIFQTKLYDTMTFYLASAVKRLVSGIEEKKHRSEEMAGAFQIETPEWAEVMSKKEINYARLLKEAEREEERMREASKELEIQFQAQEKEYKRLVGQIEKWKAHNKQIDQYEEAVRQLEKLEEEKKRLLEERKALDKEVKRLPGRRKLLEEEKAEAKELEETLAKLRRWRTKKNQLLERQKEYLKLDETAKLKKQEYERQDDRYRKAAAGILASGLEEGAACPVCGSLHHPAPALCRDELPDEKQLKQLRSSYETAWNKAMEAQTQAASLAGEVKAVEETMEGVSLENEGLDTALALKWKEKKENVRCLEQEIQDLESRDQERRIRLEKVKTACEQGRAGLKAPREREKKDLVELTGRLEELEQSRRQAIREKERAAGRIQGNRRAYAALKGHLKEKEELERRYGIVREIERAANGYNNRNLVFEQYVLSVYFDDILNAANQRLLKMSSDRYCLHRVLQSKDKRSREGMELEVSDQYTGRKRSVKSLSGGETFHAALALALGTSDVIQRYAGGIQVEALFVDEGFGALDSESLNQAVDTLTCLSGGSRMIGIISHVEELKDRVEHQIMVEKTNLGSRIKTGSMV